MEIGKRIAALRETKGWTTNRLANQCGLSQSFLRSVELGEKGISVESLKAYESYSRLPPAGVVDRSAWSTTLSTWRTSTTALRPGT